MNSKIEEIDSIFSGIWSTRKKMECGDLFLNSNLLDDVFFNKLTNITCISESMITDTIDEFKKYNSKVFVYSLNYSELDKFLLEKNFTHYDTQHVLKKNSYSSTKNDLEKISPTKSMIWANIFCNSYDCMDWLETVNSIVKNSTSQIEYYVDTTHSACMALIEKSSILGLYCLGTLPEKRKQGLASLLIDFASWKVKQEKLDFLMLETYEKDDLLKFYEKLGFENLYHKTVYTI
jgi:hypothetical protein